MKDFPQYILLYDKDCPLCVMYARLFARWGFMPPESFVAWSDGIQIKDLIFDYALSQDKIALIHPQTNQVIYGIDSILKILEQKLPWVGVIGRFPVIYFILERLYNFIAINRKIIAAIDCGDHCPCYPSRRYSYRIVFILICSIVVSSLVSLYFRDMLGAYRKPSIIQNEMFFFYGQIAFQFLVFRGLKQKNFYNYAAHLSFVSFLGAILLGIAYVCLSLVHSLGMNIELLSPICFGIVLCFMFFEHKRRVALEHWSAWLSLSWVIYRLIIYPIAFQI